VRSCVGAVCSVAPMAEVPKERFLKGFPMFQGKVREVIIKTVDNHIHNIHPLLQLQDPIFPLLLHRVLHGSDSRSPPLSPTGIFVPSLLPELSGSIVSRQEIHSHLVVMGDVGGSIVQVLLHVERSIRFEGRGEVEGGGRSVEQGVVGSVSRH
jgi:hypothetical protein